MEDFGFDDFGDLYADVEMQATSAISAIQALTGSSFETDTASEDSYSPGANDGVGSGTGAGAAVEKEEGGNNGQLNVSESGSESEDDFDIVLNDHTANESSNKDKLSGDVELGFGNWINEEENVFEMENGGNYGMVNHLGTGGRGGRSSGGHSPLHKYGRSRPATYSNDLEKNASIQVPSYHSSLIRDDREDDSFTHNFATKSIVNQNRHNVSLPRSRTILDVNIDAFDQKPWRHPGADLTDYFNFGLNEDSWKHYCNNLDRCRNRTTKVIDCPGYNHSKHTKDQEIGSRYGAVAVVAMAVPDKSAKSKQKRTVSPIDEIFFRDQHSEMPKGRSIEVEGGNVERQPSADIKHPIEQDSDKASENEIASADGANMLHISSDGGEKSFKMEGPAEGTGKPVSERCLRKTSASDSNPVSLDSDKDGCLILPDSDEQLQLTDSDSDGMPEAVSTFEEPKAVGGAHGAKTAIAQSRKKLELSHGKQHPCSRSSSPSGTSKGHVCTGSKGYQDHLKRALKNSDSESREPGKFDHHSQKDARHCGISSRSTYGDNTCVRRRSYVNFHDRKCGRMSRLKNHLDDASAYSMSDGEFYDKHDYKHQSTVMHDKQRSRMHPYVLHKGKDDFHYEVPEYSSNHGGARPFSRLYASSYDACCGRRHREFFDGDRGQSPIPSGKQQFLEQRMSVLSGAIMKRKLHQRERELFIHEMDFFESERVKELITEPSESFHSRSFTGWKRKAKEHCFTGTGGFLPKNDYSYDFTRSHERVTDYIETKHARHLPYARRDAKSAVSSERKYDSRLNGHETICWGNYDEWRSRYTGDGLSLHAYKEHQNASRGRAKSGTSLRDGIFQRNGSLKRLDCREECRDSYTLGNCSDDFDCDKITKNEEDFDEFARRAHYQQSEVLPSTEQKYNTRSPDDFLQADRMPSHFDRTSYPVDSRCKILVHMHDSGGRDKFVNSRELDCRSYRSLKEDESYSQFVCYPNIVPREKYGQMHQRYWDSSDSLMVVGDRKSSRCSKAGSLTSSGGSEFLDWNDELEYRNHKDINKSRLCRTYENDYKRINARQDDVNPGTKFLAAQQKDYLDIEEGQIIAEDFMKPPVENAFASEGTSKPITMKNSPADNAADREKVVGERDENPRIKELIEKMEKRRERFKQPLAVKGESEKAKSLVNDNALITEVKPQRPARKRRWIGN